MTNPVLEGRAGLDDLHEREREILSILVANGGQARQQDVLTSINVGRTHVSRLINRLDQAGHLKKIHLGGENVLYLPGCEPAIVQQNLTGAVIE